MNGQSEQEVEIMVEKGLLGSLCVVFCKKHVTDISIRPLEIVWTSGKKGLLCLLYYVSRSDAILV